MTGIVARWRRRSAMENALRLIARGGCENYTNGVRCWAFRDRIRGAHYTAEAWCEACVAQDGLDGGPHASIPPFAAA